jgi:hypothetical protein
MTKTFLVIFAMTTVSSDSRLRGNDKNFLIIFAMTTVSSSVEAVLFIRRLNSDFDLKLEPRVRDNRGRDAFWYADQYKNAAEIRKILNFKFLSFPF